MATDTATIEAGAVVKVTHWQGYYRVQFVHRDRATLLGPVTEAGRVTDHARRRSAPLDRIRP